MNSVWRVHMIDVLRRTRSLEMQEDFLRRQWQSLEDIRSYQWHCLQKLLRHAYRNVPYYRDLFDDIGLLPEHVTGWDELRRIPVLTKKLIRENQDRLKARNASIFLPRKKATGGSTGEPVNFLMDESSHSALWAYIYRAWKTGGWSLGEKMIFMGGTSVFPSYMSLRSYLYRKLHHWMVLSSYDFNDGVLYRWIDKIRKFKSRFMYGYSGSIYIFARALKEKNIRDIHFRSIFTTSEKLHPHFRSLIEEVFQCEVFDMYGGADGGGYAFECEWHGGLHLVESSLVEVVEENGEPVKEGEDGDIVSTDLYNYAMPFIRYKVEDIATHTDQSCPCGRGLPLLKDIKGRTDDVVTQRDGSTVHVSYFDLLFKEFPEVHQYFIIQENEQSLRIYIKPSRSDLREDSKSFELLKRIIRRRLPQMQIHVELTQSLPRKDNGKFKVILVNQAAMTRPY